MLLVHFLSVRPQYQKFVQARSFRRQNNQHVQSGGVGPLILGSVFTLFIII